MAKSDRLYKDSPSVGRDKESGEVLIRRPSQAAMEDIGLAGNPLEQDKDGGMPIDVEQVYTRLSREVNEMHKRYEDEQKDMHKRHQKELAKLLGKDEDDSDDEGESEASDKSDKDKPKSKDKE